MVLGRCQVRLLFYTLIQEVSAREQMEMFATTWLSLAKNISIVQCRQTFN